MSNDRITIDQHLAWPETRIGYVLSFVDRELPGWERGYLHGHLFDWIAKADIDDEAHF